MVAIASTSTHSNEILAKIKRIREYVEACLTSISVRMSGSGSGSDSDHVTYVGAVIYHETRRHNLIHRQNKRRRIKL